MNQPKTRIQIYNDGLVDQLIELASKDDKLDNETLIKVLDILEKLIQNISELEVIAQTNAFYFVCQLLKDQKKYNQEVIIQTLTTLQSFVQSEDTCDVLIKYHKLLNLLAGLPQQCEQTHQFSQKMGAILFTMMTVYPKCTNKIASFGFSWFFIQIFQKYQKIQNDQENLTIYISLLAMDKLLQDKHQLAYFMQQKFDQICLNLLNEYINQLNANNIILTDDTMQVLLNIISTLVIQQPQLALQMINNKVLQQLREILQNFNVSKKVRAFALSCFIEIFYANKGSHFSNVLYMLRSLEDETIDKSLQCFVEYIQAENDNDIVLLYGQLIKMICSVQKKDDFIRRSLLQFGLLKIFTDKLTEKTIKDKQSEDKYDISCKISILGAMSQLLCAREIDKKTLVDDIPSMIVIVKRLKREWSSKEYVKSQQHKDAVEQARQVLEKVGDSEGRDNKKATQISWIIVCCSVILGASISLLIR